MANPQKENGYTTIANELLEALAKIRISGEAGQVLHFIIRKTYGFNKREDAISLSQFCLGTGLHRSAVCKGILKLKTLNLITQKVTSIASSYQLNKDFDTWKPLPKKRHQSPKGKSASHQKVNNLNPKGDIQKKVTKETITKESVATPLPTTLRRKDDFFENLENQDKVIKWLVGKGMDESFAKVELDKFIGYWTEKDTKGKMRYEGQKFFEVKRRLATWFSRVNGNFNNKPSTGRTRKVIKL